MQIACKVGHHLRSRIKYYRGNDEKYLCVESCMRTTMRVSFSILSLVYKQMKYADRG